MNKRKWKKLSKRFACAIALAMLMSVNPAWADINFAVDQETNTLTGTGIDLGDNSGILGTPETAGNVFTYDGVKYDLRTYDKIVLNSDNSLGIKTWSGRFNLSNTDVEITVTGTTNNTDAVHLTSHGPYFIARNFSAYVHSPTSDALNLSHDAHAAPEGQGYAYIRENLTAVVDNGNGIRANASLEEGSINSITVDGTTDITIKTGTVTVENKLGGIITATADYKPAAVYAGDSCYFFDYNVLGFIKGTAGSETLGQGTIKLNGDSILTTYGDGNYGVFAGKNGKIYLNNISITANGQNSFGIATRDKNMIYNGESTFMGNTLTDKSTNRFGSEVVMNGDANTISMGKGGKALYAESQYAVIRSGENGIGYLNATGDIVAEDSGAIDLALREYLTVNGTVSAASNGTVMLASAGQNSVASDGTEHNGTMFGAGDALTADAEGSSVLLSSAAANYVGGGVSATDNGVVSITGAAGAEGSVADGVNNSVLSSAVKTATVTKDDGTKENVSFTNAVYAKSGGSVEITAGDGGVNTIASYTPEATADSKERTVWAANGGTVKITGVTSVTAGLTAFDGASNSAGIAIAAGTDDWTANAQKDDADKIIFDVAPADRSHVYLNYGDAAGTASSVTGDIVSGYGGSVSVARAQDASAASIMRFSGNALAANGGELTLTLGDGGIWHGRADDYKDAESEEWRETHTDIFAPQFSNGIQSNGSVNVDLGSGSIWNVTGQSWVSKLEGDGHIYLNGEETGGYAVHIGELTGSNTFYLNLYNGDKIGDGDMIYIAKEVSAPQKIEIVNRDTVLSSMKAGDRIRFATIGGEVGFSEGAASTQPAAAFGRSTRIKDAGMLNVDFSIDYLDYNHADNDDENHDAYHGGQEMQEDKPGAKYVDSIYGANENSQNVYITRLESTENPTEEPKLSDAGRTVLNMSRANYAAAVYMDRLNKRMGEARYFAGQDEGIWARIRHDRVGRDDAFLVQNTMFEVGYDRKIASKTGTRRVGIAADYMEGDTEYNDIAGEGEIDRFGLWLYSTWLGEKGHYTDYVLKWGRMSNEFDIYGMSTGERITGDYDNNVFSASAEYGRKIELGKGWFFEPQAQVQFAVITGADYVTSQGTQVDVDGINSLIGRAGFRLGKEFGGLNKGQFYIKADVLHEFLGDQDIHALDATTDGKWYYAGYENDGTWYDVGLGVSCKAGKNSYLFLDLEHSFGNDNNDSYQVSAGVQWSL